VPDGGVFRVEVVTPERILLEGDATEVILRTGEGDATFLDDHTPLVGSIEPGLVRVARSEREEVRIAGHGGFVQVEQDADLSGDGEEDRGTRVTLLLGVAELAEEIDVERAGVARETAEARLTELGGPGGAGAGGEEGTPDREVAEVQAALLRAEVRLETADAERTTPAA
jgi:F-type H+-transporting ATPase subunit epsilon